MSQFNKSYVPPLRRQGFAGLDCDSDDETQTNKPNKQRPNPPKKSSKPVKKEDYPALVSSTSLQQSLSLDIKGVVPHAVNSLRTVAVSSIASSSTKLSTDAPKEAVALCGDTSTESDYTDNSDSEEEEPYLCLESDDEFEYMPMVSRYGDNAPSGMLLFHAMSGY